MNKAFNKPKPYKAIKNAALLVLKRKLRDHATGNHPDCYYLTT